MLSMIVAEHRDVEVLTFTLFLTSNSVGGFPDLDALATGSFWIFLLSFNDIFWRSSPRVMIGITTSESGKV